MSQQNTAWPEVTHRILGFTQLMMGGPTTEPHGSAPWARKTHEASDCFTMTASRHPLPVHRSNFLPTESVGL